MAPATPARTPASRTVIWAGLIAGTAVTVPAVMHGIRVPGPPLLVSVLVTWMLPVALAITGAELLRRHHRALARQAARHGRRGALAAGRSARRGSAAAIGYLAARAAPRWQARQPEPPVFTLARPGPYPGPAAPITTRRPDGKPETAADTRFFNLREAGYAGPIDQDGNAARPTPTGGTPAMTDTPGPAVTPPARSRPAPGGGTWPAAWKQLIADTADFEPEDDSALLEWMAAEVNGMSAYAEALTEVYETCVNSVGLDPVAMAATHDVADAAAEAASAMATARQKFAGHYAEVREFAASGGLLPYDGRWITGDGDA